MIFKVIIYFVESVDIELVCFFNFNVNLDCENGFILILKIFTTRKTKYILYIYYINILTTTK